MVADFSVFRRFFLRAGVAAVASLALAACEKAPSFHSTDVSGADLGADLSLPDFDGRPRALQDFKGKVLVVFFGFVQCPDVCPTTLADLTQVKAQLGPDGDRLQVVFVTVEATARVAKSFRVFYAKVPGKEPGSYTMDHTAGIYIYDPEGRLRLFARHNTGVDALASDIKQLL
jgi:protein SCO1/2